MQPAYKVVHGLLSGEMDEEKAYDTLCSVMNSKATGEKTTVNFEHEYSISLNDKNGRDAASSIRDTVRNDNKYTVSSGTILLFHFFY